MPRIRPLKLVLPLVVLLAGACAAPAASPPAPTAPPPTVPATAVAPTLTDVPPTLAPTAAPPTLAPTPDLLPVVTAFQAAYNQHDTDTLMTLFAADPRWIIGFGIFAFAGSDSGVAYTAATTQAVRDMLNIGFELNSRLEASKCSTKNNKATCDLEIQDDCNPPAAIPYHVRAEFAFKDGKIASLSGRWGASDQIAFLPYDAARREWAIANLPAEQAAYNPFAPDAIVSNPAGVPTGETAIQFGQSMERICTGYAAAAQ